MPHEGKLEVLICPLLPDVLRNRRRLVAVLGCMDSFLTDLRHSFRLLIKSPGFTLVAIIALALGIGANTAIFSVLDRVLLRPLPFPDSERIMNLHRHLPNGDEQSVSIPKFMAWRQSLWAKPMA